MKKEEFIRQLEYLLQDIQEDDKRDAIDYYSDYLEEGRSERERQRFWKDSEALNGLLR